MHWTTIGLTSYFVLWIVVVLQVILTLSLARAVGQLRRRERGLFLLYVSPHCSLCSGLLPSAKRFFKEIAAEADGVWVMVLGSREAQIFYARENELTRYPVAAEEQMPARMRVEGAPFGLWINAQGQVKAKGMVDRREHLESLRHAARIGHPSIESYVAARVEEEEQERERRTASH